MKQFMLAAALSGVSSFAVSATCQYPLNATAAQYAMSNMLAFPYINLQLVEYTSQPTPSIMNYIAASEAGAQAAIASASTGQPGGDIVLPASGIVGVEFAIDHFPAFTTSAANLNISFGFATSNNIGDISVLNGLAGSGLTFGLGFSSFTNGAWSMPIAYRREGQQSSFADGVSPALPQPLPASFRSGIYLNMGSRQMGYTINGVDYGYMKNADGSPFTIPVGVQSGMLLATGLMQVNSGSDATIGTPVGGTLVTDRSQFTQPFPAGTVDFCGNSSGPVLPNGKPFPGKGHAYGLLKNGAVTMPVLPLGLGSSQK